MEKTPRKNAHKLFLRTVRGCRACSCVCYFWWFHCFRAHSPGTEPTLWVTTFSEWNKRNGIQTSRLICIGSEIQNLFAGAFAPRFRSFISAQVLFGIMLSTDGRPIVLISQRAFQDSEFRCELYCSTWNQNSIRGLARSRVQLKSKWIRMFI